MVLHVSGLYSFYSFVGFCFMDAQQFVCLFTSWRSLGFFPDFVGLWIKLQTHSLTHIFLWTHILVSLGKALRSGTPGSHVNYLFNSKKLPHYFPKWSNCFCILTSSACELQLLLVLASTILDAPCFFCLFVCFCFNLTILIRVWVYILLESISPLPNLISVGTFQSPILPLKLRGWISPSNSDKYRGPIILPGGSNCGFPSVEFRQIFAVHKCTGVCFVSGQHVRALDWGSE